MEASKQLNWYVGYTYPKAEKKVQRKVTDIGVESFLPMSQVVRQWSDRKKKLEMPVFPNYIFIHATAHERHQTLNIRELVRFVSFEGNPVTISDEEIESIKTVLSMNAEISNERFHKMGTKVEITSGEFAGATGILLRKEGKQRLLVQLEALQQAFSVSLQAGCVEEV